jgi:ABC-2 type transport system ATP-binding protein
MNYKIAGETMESNQNQTNSSPLLRMENASLDFGGGAGVFDLNLTLQKGSILGVIGPSGCGKTTTIRLLNGIYGPTSGEVFVFDKNPLKFNAADKARIGYIPQQFILYPNLSAEENMHFMGGIYGMTSSERKTKIKSLLEFVELEDARKRLARKMSGGMQRRLMLAGALLHDPDLLIADEPTAGIDPILRARIWDSFRELRNQDKTLLVTTQYVGEAAYCDLVAVMRNGRLVTVDTPKGLQRQAMDGEVVHIQVEESQQLETILFLEKLPQVHKVERLTTEEGGMYVYVDDSGKEIPNLLAILNEQEGITPLITEPYLPPFDEVFVRLIRSAELKEYEEQPQ